MKYLTNASPDGSVSEREIRNKEVAYKAALEGIVLLKNDGVLPLKSKDVAVYGAGAEFTIKGGTGSGEVNERHSVSIFEGLTDAGFNVTTKKWLEDFKREYEDGMRKWGDEARKRLSLFNISASINIMANPYQTPYGRDITDEDVKDSACEVAIYVVSRQAGEAADKKIENGEYDLSVEEIKHIKKIASSYKKCILVINSGASMNLNILDEVDISAVIYFCQQGTAGGTAFADLVSGKVSPSGKLVDTWAKRYDDIPFAREYSYLSGDTTQEYYKEGIYVGYRYFDTFGIEPRFRFGYGLSYTTFDIKTNSVKLDKSLVSLSLTVKNTGEYDGKEVVQIYVSAPSGKLSKEYQRLVAFQKTDIIKVGDESKLSIAFDMSYCASFDEESASHILEKGNYLVRVGNSSINTEIVAAISLDETAVVSKSKNVCKRTLPVEEIVPVERANTEAFGDAVILSLQASDITTKEYKYGNMPIYHDEAVDAIMNKLTVKEMIDVVVGDGIGGMLNTKKLYTPGSVGRTTDKLYKKGLINVNLSDGPAGLRLQRRSARTKSGKIKMLDAMISFMNYFPPLIKKIMFGNAEKDEVLYQYTTAFPVGTAIAQSWNDKLAEEIGNAVSDEMVAFNVTYWLAPAQNIHRNPLCGRNFEYFSEDPVISGKISAGLTRGVQSINGNYVTIKHFACNNQEDNRTFSNSNINERALREIYLRGFEIAVKEGGAKSVMTSYNLINGTYAPNIYELLVDVLRTEWGFDGVVMTDWYSTNKGQGRNDLAIKAGNDMIMPGGRWHAREIQRGLKNGTLTEEELRRAAANVVRSIVHSEVATRVTVDMFD